MARKKTPSTSLQDNVDQGLVIVIIVGLLAGWLITAVKQNTEIQLLKDQNQKYEQTIDGLERQPSSSQ